MDYFNAFWVGGVICALVQILLDKTKLMPGRVMVSSGLLGCSFERDRNLSAICRLVQVPALLFRFSASGRFSGKV